MIYSVLISCHINRFTRIDDGDEEGREMDYIESSDSDESDPEMQVNDGIQSTTPYAHSINGQTEFRFIIFQF